MPLQPRAKSKASQENDARILEAGIAEAHAVGLDRIALRAVVRRCNLTSGAIYGRYEDSDDFIASVWTERLGAPLFDFLSGAMGAFLGTEGSPSIDSVAATVANPPKHLAVAFEALVVGRRNDVLGDEVADDFALWAEKWGLGSATDPSVRALNVVAFTTIMGAALYSFVEPKLADWNLVFAIMAAAIRDTSTARSTKAPPIGDELPNFDVEPGTGEPLRDALISATANVIGRTGYERATVSRIGRRAKLTGGAVYTRYETKDDLIIDTLDTLLSGAIVGTSELTAHGVKSGDLGESIGKIYTLGVTPSRKQWRQFRLETYVAARTRKEPRAALRRVHSAGLVRYNDMLGPRSRMDDGVIRLVARGGQSIPLGLSLLESYQSDLHELNFHAFSASLVNLLRTV
ncbi:MAG: TetR family transcriptional regulator [Acidobacteria bacterium]|nr:TetR family transcriptional regulator [Acidobacteriota bacterium]